MVTADQVAPLHSAAFDHEWTVQLKEAFARPHEFPKGTIQP